MRKSLSILLTVPLLAVSCSNDSSKKISYKDLFVEMSSDIEKIPEDFINNTTENNSLGIKRSIDDPDDNIVEASEPSQEYLNHDHLNGSISNELYKYNLEAAKNNTQTVLDKCTDLNKWIAVNSQNKLRLSYDNENNVFTSELLSSFGYYQVANFSYNNDNKSVITHDVYNAHPSQHSYLKYVEDDYVLYQETVISDSDASNIIKVSYFINLKAECEVFVISENCLYQESTNEYTILENSINSTIKNGDYYVQLHQTKDYRNEESQFNYEDHFIVYNTNHKSLYSMNYCELEGYTPYPYSFDSGSISLNLFEAVRGWDSFLYSTTAGNRYLGLKIGDTLLESDNVEVVLRKYEIGAGELEPNIIFKVENFDENTLSKYNLESKVNIDFVNYYRDSLTKIRNTSPFGVNYSTFERTTHNAYAPYLIDNSRSFTDVVNEAKAINKEPVPISDKITLPK